MLGPQDAGNPVSAFCGPERALSGEETSVFYFSRLFAVLQRLNPSMLGESSATVLCPWISPMGHP